MTQVGELVAKIAELVGALLSRRSLHYGIKFDQRGVLVVGKIVNYRARGGWGNSIPVGYPIGVEVEHCHLNMSCPDTEAAPPARTVSSPDP